MSPETTAPSLLQPDEIRRSWWYAALVLGTLTLVKPLGGIAYVGAVGFTIAAALQLYLPLWRCDRLRLPWSEVGLHLGTWRRDLCWVGVACLIFFPPYVYAHHLYMSKAHLWLDAAGFESLSALLPQRRWGPELPTTPWTWALAGWWFVRIAATHVLGVALPEETFYRGYLQPLWETKFPPRTRLLGVVMGRGAVLATGFFALGHFLGEWDPMRLGPFFPGLVFAYLRNTTGSIVGAVTFHAACNVLGEILFRLYQ